MSDIPRGARPEVLAVFPRQSGGEVRLAIIRRSGMPPLFSIGFFTSSEAYKPKAYVSIFAAESEALDEAVGRFCDALDGEESDS